MTGRSRGAVVLLTGLVLGGAGGIAAGVLLGGGDSGATPPAPAVVTAPVEKRIVRDVVDLDCTLRRSTGTIPYTPASDTTAVVTHLPGGSGIAAGGIVAEVSGRPVFALEGPFTLYRDLHPGDRGRDVHMLQAALTDAGHAVRADGVFGPGTERALTGLYRDAGYRPPTRSTVDEDSAPAPATSPGASPTPGGTASPAPQPTAASTPAPVVQVVVLRSEFVVLPDLPRRLASRPRVGAHVTDRLGTYENPGTSATCTGPRVSDARPGARVSFTEPAGVTGTVATIADAAGATPASQDAAGAAAAPTALVTLHGASASSAADAHLTGQIVLAGSAAPVLAVPASAVGGSGDTGVLTVHDPGGDRRVDVTVGTVAGGYVQVTPAAGAQLAVGDPVVVGGTP